MSGKANGLDRIAEGLVWFVALFALANGAFMLLFPMGWYEALPTVRATGPANTHFIADIGIAYLGCGVILAYAGLNLRMRWLAALAGGLWLMAHGALHFYELVAGICSPGRFWTDFPGTIGIPLLVFVAVASLIVRQRIAPAGLPKRVVVSAADRMLGGDAAYIHEIAAAPGHALEKFLHFMPVSDHRHAAPRDAFNMARIGSTLVEDCAACAMIVARAANAEGVPEATINAALAGGEVLEGDEALAFRFGQAVARQEIAESASFGDALEARFGRVVRLELAMTAAFTRTYPAIKRGLGLATACSATKLSI